MLFPSYTWRHHFLTSKTKEARKLFYYISKLVLHGPLKFKAFLLPNCCVIYYQIFSTNDVNTISNWLYLLSAWFRNLKSFLVNGNRSRTLRIHNIDIINTLLIPSSRSVQWVTDPRFSPAMYGLRASCLHLGHKSKEKNSDRNSRYGPQTRLVRGISSSGMGGGGGGGFISFIDQEHFF